MKIRIDFPKVGLLLAICHLSYQRDVRDLFAVQLQAWRFCCIVQLFRGGDGQLLFHVRLPWCHLRNDASRRITGSVKSPEGRCVYRPVVTGKIFWRIIPAQEAEV